MATTSSRALRVGVLLGENLVEERLFKGDAPITIGQSLRASLSIPADGVPREHTLFAIDQNRYILQIPPGMTGRVAQSGAIQTELRSGPLERGARGKLRIGDATILFQEMAAPPVTPRPQLPASVRGSFADRVDRRLATIVAASLLVHLVIGTWAFLQDRTNDRAFDDPEMPYEPPTVSMIEPAPEPTAEPPTSDGPSVAAPAVPSRQTSRPIVQPTRIDRLPDPEDPSRWAQVMTGNTEATNGQGEIKQRIPGASLDKQIQDIRENGRDIRVGNNPTTRDGGTHIGTGPDGPHVAGPGEIAGNTKTEHPPTTRITPIPQPHPPGEPDQSGLIIARIQGQYAAGLQRCYQKFGLAVDEHMVAKVTLTFTVDEQGKSTDNAAHGASSEVDGCIQSQMSGWRFPILKDKDGDPTDKPFKILLALQPSAK